MRRSLQDSAKLQKESAAQRGQSMSMLHGHVFRRPKTADVTVCPPYRTNAVPATKGHTRTNLTFLTGANKQAPEPNICALFS